ncbi:UNVERIFIED_CONTAM: hypothetical protein FKN15_037458 [Acipenser sinensis]
MGLCCPGEPLGQFSADIRYLVQQEYNGFTAAAKDDLATEAFLRGLTLDALRHHVRLTTPTGRWTRRSPWLNWWKWSWESSHCLQPPSSSRHALLDTGFHPNTLSP